MDVEKYRRLFLDESREHLEVLTRELLALEQEGAGDVDAMFRAAHSVKGMSGSMGYDAMVAVSHALEDVLDRLRGRSLAPGPELMALLYEGVDTLSALAGEIEETGATSLAVDGIRERLLAAAREEEAAPPAPAQEPGAGQQPEPGAAAEAGAAPEAETAGEPGAKAEREEAAEPEAAARPEEAAAPGEKAEAEEATAEEPGAEGEPQAEAEAAEAAVDGLAPVETDSGAPAAAEPEPAPGFTPEAGEELVAARGDVFVLEPEKLAMVRDFVRSGLVPYACTLRVARDSAALAARNFVILGRLAKAGMLLAASPSLEEVRAGASRDTVEALLLTERSEEKLREELLAIPELEELQLRKLQIGRRETGGGPVPALMAQRVPIVERPAATAPRSADRYAPQRSSTVRVDTRVLDDLINLVGELIITRERLNEISRELGSEELHLNVGRLHTVVRDLQDTIMTVRMMPLDLVTDRLPRVVRDLAHRSGKRVSFEVQGRGIELDRAILEELGDVLVHLVRNAVDHGIESPAEREAAGKPLRATIRVRAGRERDWVWVRVEDDGRGMDPDRVAAAAVERGLVSAGQAAELGPREKLMLACLPGVSTAERVSDVSGRGVGMDVVKAKVDAFGGAVRIDARPGGGTAITMRLPLTLAIVRILLVGVRGQEYGLPVSHVARTGELEPAEVEWSQRRALLRRDGGHLPLVDLGVLLGLPPRDLRAHPGLFIVEAEFGERRAALAVDRLLGTYEIVVKPLGPPLKRVRGLAGVTVMGDGRTVLLLDPAALVQATA